MSFKTLLNLLLLAVCLISSVIKINSQDPQPTPTPTTFPLEKILTSEEMKLIQSGKNLIMTPLEYERIVDLAWLSGLSDMKKQLARNLTETGKTIDYNFVKKMNEENAMILPVKQIEYQFIHAYALGTLNPINRVLRESGIEIPRMKLATDEDIKKMHKMYPNLMKMFEKSQVEQKQEGTGIMMQTMAELNNSNENKNDGNNKLSDSEMETAQFFFGGPYYGGFGYRPWGFGGGYGFGYPPWGFGWRRFWW